MFLANILSVNSASIHRRHTGSQMDVGTGAGGGGAEVRCSSVCGGGRQEAGNLGYRMMSVPMEGSWGAEGA